MDYCNQIMAGAAARIEIMHGYIERDKYGA